MFFKPTPEERKEGRWRGREGGRCCGDLGGKTGAQGTGRTHERGEGVVLGGRRCRSGCYAVSGREGLGVRNACRRTGEVLREAEAGGALRVLGEGAGVKGGGGGEGKELSSHINLKTAQRGGCRREAPAEGRPRGTDKQGRLAWWWWWWWWWGTFLPSPPPKQFTRPPTMAHPPGQH